MESIDKACEETVKKLILENKYRISFWGSVETVSSGAVIGSLCATAVTLIISPGNSILGSSVMAGISVVAVLLSHLRKNAIIKQIIDEAVEEVKKQQTIELMKEAFPFISDEDISMLLPHILAISIVPNEHSEEDFIQTQGERLMSYAGEVGYTDWEEDVAYLKNLIEGLKNGHISAEEAQESIKTMEKTMLDKAYRFCTKDITR